MRVLLWLVLAVLVAGYAWLDGIPRLTAYDHMTPAQKAFYQGLEARSFTEERQYGFDISEEFVRLYSYNDISDEALVQLLLEQGFWIQGGGPNNALSVEADGSYGGILRREIYPGIKGWFAAGEALVSLGRENSEDRNPRFEVQFISRWP